MSTYCDWCGHAKAWHHHESGPCEAQPCNCKHFRRPTLRLGPASFYVVKR